MPPSDPLRSHSIEVLSALECWRVRDKMGNQCSQLPDLKMARRTVVLCTGREAYHVLGDRRAKIVESVLRILTKCHETYVWIGSEVASKCYNIRFLRKQTSELMR